MKKPGPLYLAALMMLTSSNFALAHGGHFNHFSFGMNLGYPGFYGGYGFYDPFFYSPFYGIPPVVAPIAPPIIIPSTPPVYIQQHETPAAAQSQTHDWWYYCTSPEGYYPYVKQCPGGWLRVAPRPSTQ